MKGKQKSERGPKPSFILLTQLVTSYGYHGIVVSVVEADLLACPKTSVATPEIVWMPAARVVLARV